MLRDLDELLLSVRDSQTRSYMAEALIAHRMGANRLATVGVWTAVSYDILSKLRELKSEGDAQASAFIDRFDKFVLSNNTSELLKAERDLISEARRFEFFNSNDARGLQRIQDDRNLCAHPAFYDSTQLFLPTQESVRAHIVHAIDSLLSMPPVSGQAILTALEADIPSASFPRERERAINYVRDRYLRRMRPAVKRNFAIVLFKAQILGNVPAWNDNEQSIVHALEAVERDDRPAFEGNYLPEAARFTERADGSSLLNILPLLRAFPSLRPLLPVATVERIRAVVASEEVDLRSFYAIGLLGSEVDDAVLERLTTLSASDVATVLRNNPDERFMPAVIQGVSDAGSFREGEARLYNSLLLVDQMTASDFAAIVDAVMDNGQVEHASKTPGYLAAITQRAIARKIASGVDWSQVSTRWGHWSTFSAVWDELRNAKIFARLEDEIQL